ncbi:MAG: DNA (cytosine-5-)-methyltransferase [Desulfobulbaceae bacterium]|nr:DNA (cytosine-5-)-methyltransferase [Desulfobulbaceae bacterium]
MRHLDLFSGIGGFALAAGWAGYETIQFVETDPFCQKVLQKHWPDVPIHSEIKTFDVTNLHGTVDLITGGFPCQPYSQSGKRLGNKDDRALWTEMLRVIKEVRPSFVVGENVIYSAEMALFGWKIDLENIGYEVSCFDISASALELSTMERHIWIIASANGKRQKRDSIQPTQKWGTPIKFQGSDTGVGERRNICESRFCRVGERVSGKLDKVGRERLKAIGNAIPPQVAYEIIKAIPS